VTTGSGPTIAPNAPVGPPIATSPAPDALGSPAWFPRPTTGRILFVIEDASGSHVAYLDANGQHEIPQVVDKTLAKAVWAGPDSILFDSERDVRRHIFRMQLDGGEVAQLTSGAAIQERPAISPDGSTIAYAEFVDADLGADSGLHLANADGTRPRALTKGGKGGPSGGDTSPAFSPDGRWVAFQRAVDFDAGTGGLFLIRTDGSGERRLTDDTLGAGSPRWSPDGKRILFSQRLEATTFAPGPLWVVDVAVGEPAPLTDPADPGLSFSGDWSPDGHRIVYNHYVPGAVELRIADADGTHASTLLIGAFETPDWGP
jgi:Tol biopolymer transport system component